MNRYHFIIFIIIASRKLKLIFWKHLEDLSNFQTNSRVKVEISIISKLTKKKDDIYTGIFLAQLACRVEVKELADKIFIAI